MLVFEPNQMVVKYGTKLQNMMFIEKGELLFYNKFGHKHHTR